MSDRPVIGITMGDAAGVGPEIILKALREKRMVEQCRPLVIGDAAIMERADTFVKTGLQIKPVASVNEAEFKAGQVDVPT